MTTWVLLRGLAREARHWGTFPELLRAHLPPGDRVVAIDLPGNGRRWREDTPASVAGMVRALRAELAERGPPGPYLVLALSLGGMVAVEWARQAPGELRACVLINSSMGSLSPWWQRLRPAGWMPLLRSLAATSHAARERAVFAMTSSAALDERVVAAWAEIASSQPVRLRNVLAQLLAAARYRAPASLAIPVLVLCSRGDRLVSPRCSLAMAQAWRAPLREHPSAGHDLPLDDPAWIVRQVIAW